MCWLFLLGRGYDGCEQNSVRRKTHSKMAASISIIPSCYTEASRAVLTPLYNTTLLFNKYVLYPFDAHCCHIGGLIFDIRAL